MYAVEVLRPPDGSEKSFELTQVSVEENAVRNWKRELLVACSGDEPSLFDERFAISDNVLEVAWVRVAAT